MWLSNFQGNSSASTGGKGCVWSQRNQVEGCPAMGSLAVGKPLQLRDLPTRNGFFKQLALFRSYDYCQTLMIVMSIPFLSTQTCPSCFHRSPGLAGFIELSSPAPTPDSTQGFLPRRWPHVSEPSWLVFSSGQSQFLLTWPSSCCSFLHSTDPQFKIVFFPRVWIPTLMYPSSNGLRISTTIFLQRHLAGHVLCTLHNPSLRVLLLCPNLLWNSSLCLLCALQV